MSNLKIFSLINYKKYIYLVLISNFFSVLFLHDTTSFNLGLISSQSLLYSLNNFFFIGFIIFETIASYLDFYGLNLNFLSLIFINSQNLNFDFNFYIFFINLKYFLFLIFNLIFLFYFDKILNVINNLYNRKIFILTLIIILISLFFYFKNNYSNTLNTLSNRISEKLTFITKGNFLRNDNWYIVTKNTIDYSNTDSIYSNFSFEEEFRNFKNLENIYIILNESYPNFRNPILKKELLSVLTSNLKGIEIHNSKKNWSKNYSTQGSEFELFCDKKGSWNDFNKDLDFFLKKNDCWINTFYNRHNIFIHSFKKSSFSRSRYFNGQNSFFNEFYFKEELLELDYEVCEKNIYYEGICENQIISELLFNLKNINKKKLVIYLTVENHIPVKIINDSNYLCKEYTLKLHPQFCTLFKNQLNFNKELNNFIRKLDTNDLLVFFSDSPPLYSRRDRVHFEDYIDVFFFKKK